MPSWKAWLKRPCGLIKRGRECNAIEQHVLDTNAGKQLS